MSDERRPHFPSTDPVVAERDNLRFCLTAAQNQLSIAKRKAEAFKESAIVHKRARTVAEERAKRVEAVASDQAGRLAEIQLRLEGAEGKRKRLEEGLRVYLAICDRAHDGRQPVVQFWNEGIAALNVLRSLLSDNPTPERLNYEPDTGRTVSYEGDHEHRIDPDAPKFQATPEPVEQDRAEDYHEQREATMRSGEVEAEREGHANAVRGEAASTTASDPLAEPRSVTYDEAVDRLTKWAQDPDSVAASPPVVTESAIHAAVYRMRQALKDAGYAVSSPALIVAARAALAAYRGADEDG